LHADLATATLYLAKNEYGLRHLLDEAEVTGRPRSLEGHHKCMRFNIRSRGCVNIGYKLFGKHAYFPSCLGALESPTSQSVLPSLLLKSVYFTHEPEKCKIVALLADLLGTW
jgi:hypothetical protein